MFRDSSSQVDGQLENRQSEETDSFKCVLLYTGMQTKNAEIYINKTATK